MSIINIYKSVSSFLLENGAGAVDAASEQEYHMNAALGFGACAVATLFFGSNFIPVKKYKTGMYAYTIYIYYVRVIRLVRP